VKKKLFYGDFFYLNIIKNDSCDVQNEKKKKTE